ncbi:P-loop NTPase fold protein [Thomasclavelia ramosa]|uniref:P-loop NTPase fold protein n=1 Tax=Thomasclavelia ramosa TaxID=1547 RepID=UPI00344DA09C
MTTNDYIIDYIKKYINNDIALPSSVMINGKWGCGKTYFIIKELIPILQKEFKNKRIAYITLNGVSTSDELERRIQTAIIKINYNEENKNNVFELVSGIDSYLPEQKISSFFGIASSLGRIAKKYFVQKKLDETILIFDDLERSTLKCVESLGIINDLIEHKKSKCIIIANESEIKEAEASNYSYKSIKEKLISRTLIYEPDLELFLDKLYKNTFCNNLPIECGKNTWISVKNEILKITDGNLRTILSSISIANEVYSIIKDKLVYNDAIIEIILRDLTIDIYRVEMWYKNGNERPKPITESKYYSMYCFGKEKKNDDYKLSFVLTQNIIFDGHFDVELIENSIKDYVKFISVNGKASPLTRLKVWYKMEDDFIQVQYDNLIESLDNHSASIETYQDILKLCFVLDDIGFKNEQYNSLDKIIDLMKNNISKFDNEFHNFEYNGLTSNVKDDYLPKLKETLKEFRELSLNSFSLNTSETLNKYLNFTDWADRLYIHVKYFKNMYRTLNGFLYLLDYDKLLVKIKNATNNELCTFRDTMYLIYQEHFSKESYPNDEETIIQLCEDLQTIECSGKINRNTINYIIGDYKRFFEEIFEVDDEGN